MEISFFDRQSQGGKRPRWNRYLLHFVGNNFKYAGFEDHAWIDCVNHGKLLLGSRKILKQTCLPTPQTDAPSNVFCTDCAEHLTRHCPLKVIAVGMRRWNITEGLTRERGGK